MHVSSFKFSGITILETPVMVFSPRFLIHIHNHFEQIGTFNSRNVSRNFNMLICLIVHFVHPVGSYGVKASKMCVFLCASFQAQIIRGLYISILNRHIICAKLKTMRAFVKKSNMRGLHLSSSNVSTKTT